MSYTEAAPKQPDDAKDEGDPRLGEYQDLNDVVLKGLAVARARLSGDQLKDLQVIWRQTPKTIGRGHFGGQTVFAPDGTLFITSGDRQRFDPAQDLGSTLGKIVRINPDGSIPPDNPFVNQPGALPEIWNLGHRNPLGAAFEPGRASCGARDGSERRRRGQHHREGQELWLAGRKQGQSLQRCADSPSCTEAPTSRPPLKFWNPSISPSGLLFYTGDTFKELKGSALLGGLSSEALIVLFVEDGKALDDSIVSLGTPRTRRRGDAGRELLLLTDGDDAELLRLTPAADTGQP